MAASALNYKQIFTTSPIAIFICQDGQYRVVNPMMTRLTGFSGKELLKIPFTEQIHPEDRDRVVDSARRRLAGEDVPDSYEFRALNRNGEVHCLRGFFSIIEYSGRPAILGQLIDITNRVMAEEKIKASEAKYRELADSLPEVVFEVDEKGIITYGNNNCYDVFRCTKEDFERGIRIVDYVASEDQERAAQNIFRIMNGEVIGTVEYTARRKDGSTFPLIIHSVPVIKDGRTVGLRGVIMDITERKQMEERLKTLSLRDPLTGLYNRAYFENEIERLESGGYSQASVLMCDVDGLKIINDSFGHDCGDALLIAAADVLRSSLRDSDIIARIGGDEFAVILPNCGQIPAEKAFSRILGAVENYNAANPSLPLSLSVGFATTRRSLDLRDLYKEADNNMYREKLHQSRSTRSAVVQTLVKAMEARDFNTEGHAERLLDLVLNLGRAMDLPKQKLDDLRLFAKFHDIGKVGIADSILFKPGPLTPSETIEMRRHSEIGHRIAQSAPDLALIADWILKHHEWWNGEGYPIGLKGEEIPLECRILAIVDAYDAMTSDRPYRSALSQVEAVAELERCAGTQFDPVLVKKFLKILDIVQVNL